MVAREPDNAAPNEWQRDRENEQQSEKPRHQRPELPEFWDHRFRQGVIPWDAGRVPGQFAEFSRQHHAALASRQGAGRARALVPGCGSAYEAGHLDAEGWDTLALDFSPAAIDAARNALPDYGGALHCADFFSFANERPFDLIYERAFLCALPRQRWPDYAPRMAELLRPGGLLAGYFFIDEQALKGPPFGIAAALLDEFLRPGFELIDDQPTPDAIGPFAGKERWMIWRKR